MRSVPSRLVVPPVQRSEVLSTAFPTHSGSRDQLNTIVIVCRLDVDRSTVSVSMTILVDDGIGIVRPVSDNVGVTSVSPDTVDNHRGILVVPAVTPVTIDNNSFTVTVSTSTTSFDHGGIVSVSVVRDDSRGVSVPSGCEKGLDFAEERRRGVGFSFTLVDVNDGSVSVVSVTINNNDSIISMSSGLEISVNDGDLVYMSALIPAASSDKGLTSSWS